jgi:hypothetical protein
MSDDPELFDRFPTMLPPGWCPADATPTVRFGLMRDGAITLDGAVVSRTSGDRTGALAMLGSTVRHHVAQHAPAYVFVHAGVVRICGVGIVIPGSSFSGKSTLVAELMRAGATYYSDEYAVVDAEGMIHPYATTLSIRSNADSGRFGMPVLVADGQIGTGPMRAGLIVITSYEKGAPWRPVARSRSEGALVLMEHTVAARSRPGEALAAARRLVQDARVIAGKRGEARIVAQTIVEATASLAAGAV